MMVDKGTKIDVRGSTKEYRNFRQKPGGSMYTQRPVDESG